MAGFNTTGTLFVQTFFSTNVDAAGRFMNQKGRICRNPMPTYKNVESYPAFFQFVEERGSLFCFIFSTSTWTCQCPEISNGDCTLRSSSAAYNCGSVVKADNGKRLSSLALSSVPMQVYSCRSRKTRHRSSTVWDREINCKLITVQPQTSFSCIARQFHAVHTPSSLSVKTVGKCLLCSLRKSR